MTESTHRVRVARMRSRLAVVRQHPGLTRTGVSLGTRAVHPRHVLTPTVLRTEESISARHQLQPGTWLGAVKTAAGAPDTVSAR